MQIIYHPNVQEFIGDIEELTYSRILRAIDKLKQHGHRLVMPDAKYVDRNLWELRIRGRQEVRLFYTIRGDQAFVLHGFVKKSMRIPKRELEVARHRLDALDDR